MPLSKGEPWMKDSKRKSNDHPFSIGGRASKPVTARQSLDLCLLPLSTNTGVIPAFRAPTTSSWYLLPTYNNSLFFNLIMFDPISKNLGSGLSYPISCDEAGFEVFFELAPGHSVLT